MALTFKLKPSFTINLVISTEVEQEFTKELKSWAKAYHQDPCSLTPLRKHVLITSLTYGVEAAIKEMCKSGLKDTIKENCGPKADDSIKGISPVQVR